MNFAQMLQATSSTRVPIIRVNQDAHRRSREVIRNRAIERYKESMADGPLTCAKLAAKLGIQTAACKTQLIRYRDLGLCSIVGIDPTSKSNNKPKLWKWNNE